MTSEWSITGIDPKRTAPPVEAGEARATKSREVLILNRDPEVRALLTKALYVVSLSSTCVGSDQELFACLRKGDYGIVIVGIEDAQAIELISRVREQFPSMAVLAVARLATPDLVRDVMRAGATDFFFGSLDTRSFGAKLLSFVDASPQTADAPPKARAGRGSAAPVSIPVDPASLDVGFVCTSKPMQRVLEIAEKVAPTESTVLIQGESGTGKELIAKRIHCLSKRSDKPFIEVNCGALPENLLESQLFGHEKGSFTGAVQRQVGLFEIADQGTLFLDEIGETGLDMQVKLLRALQFREFRRIGGSQVVKVDVRVIAATNKDLKSEVEKKHFRSDLYYRLNVISLEIPPLRERVEEIPDLVTCFSERIAKERGIPAKTFSSEAIDRLRNFRWTGNVRELENSVERLILLSQQPVVSAGDVDEFLGGSVEVSTASPFAPSLTLDEVKRIHIGNVLRENEGNKMKTARILKINVKTLYNLMKRLGISEEGKE